jgi:putative oxidoreductase
MPRKLFVTVNDHTLALVRLVVGIIFFAHGAQLAVDWFGGYGWTASIAGFAKSGVPPAFGALAILAEFLGGIGLIVGFLSRIAAFGIAATMIVAVLKVHLPNGFFMNWQGTQKGEGFEFHLPVIAIAVMIMLRGAGALSIDRLLGDRSSGPRHASSAVVRELDRRPTTRLRTR